MSAEQIRSIGCGPVGAVVSAIIASLIFHWQVKRWARWVPAKFGNKKKDQLLKEYKTSNRIAKAFGLAGFLTMLLYYKRQQEMTGSDWRGIGIAIGLMAFLPIAYIVTVNIVHGAEKVKEALIAFVIDQKTPPKVLFIFIGICFAVGMICAVSVLIQLP